MTLFILQVSPSWKVKSFASLLTSVYSTFNSQARLLSFTSKNKSLVYLSLLPCLLSWSKLLIFLLQHYNSLSASLFAISMPLPIFSPYNYCELCKTKSDYPPLKIFSPSPLHLKTEIYQDLQGFIGSAMHLAAPDKY